MKSKAIAWLVIVLTCGLAASYLGAGYRSIQLLAERSNAPEKRKVAILVAKTKVPAFMPIKDPKVYFELREMPEGSFPAEAIKYFSDIKGKCLQRPLNKDLPVTPDDLINVEGMGIECGMPPGRQRAVSLKVKTEAIVCGFVTPKSYVDVLYVERRSDEQTEPKVILQNLLVLAVDVGGCNLHEVGPWYTTVTLAAKPEEAAELALAASTGEIRLALRAADKDNGKRTKDGIPHPSERLAP
jgi:Flp pilus assembly protein CpaB